MRIVLPFIAAATITATSAVAREDFGSQADAQEIAAMMTEIVQAGGVGAAIDAMHATDKPFAESVLGIHVFEDGIIVADNREPELIASSYEEVADLTGEPMWPRIVAAADQSGDAVLEWYHYDTEAEYTYLCHSEWADGDTVLVMVCR